jgi:broad specificity phosphatase PhoE
MKVYVARHAETNYNVLNLCNDDPSVDVHLTQKGIKQGEVLAKSLKRVNIDAIIISELPRTKQTADLINKFHNAPILVDARINDVHNGFEGKSVDEYRAAMKGAKNRWTVRFNDGESFEENKQRVKSFLEDLKSRTEDCVLIVTHQVISRHIYGIIHGLSNEEIAALQAANTYCYDFELKT